MNTHKGWGGGEKWHFDAACFFHSLDYDVTFICKKGSVLHEKLLSENVHCQFLDVSNLSFFNPLKLSRLAVKLRQKNILFVNSPADNKLAGIASLFNKKLKVIFRRGMPHPIKPSPLNKWLFRHRVDCVIANSETVKMSLNARNKNLIPEENIKVIYNGFDIEKYHEKPFSLVFSQPDNSPVPVFVTCGRLVEQKNQLLLLKAAKLLKHKKAKFKLIIVGDGPLFDTLRQYIEKNNLADVCILAGFLENIKNALSCADIFLLSSLYEGSSNALIEACGAGLPVIASNIPSNKEVVEHGVNGHLLPVDDPHQWAEIMLQLMSDKNRQAVFGAASKNKIMNEFSTHKTQQQLKALVDNICISIQSFDMRS